MKYQLFKITFLFGLTVLLAACGSSNSSSSRKFESRTTGWNYNDPTYGGFQTQEYFEQSTPPGMVFVEGGTFTMGRIVEDIAFDWNNMQRRQTVNSFYMDQFEITNRDWREYLHWLGLIYKEMPGIQKKALPDTLVWQRALGFNDPSVDYYFRHAAYNDYPAVGVSWVQAVDYCTWRTDRVNENILAQEGFIDLPDFNAVKSNTSSEDIAFNTFNTTKYLMRSDYNPIEGKRPLRNAFDEVRKTNMSDGYLLPKYRLPTEAEWEYAAYGITGEFGEENYYQKRIYPWDGHSMRNPDKDFRGEMMANFVRGRGDMMGIAGRLNDGSVTTGPVDYFEPNDWGLYGMAGNVNEWVYDVYRTTSNEVTEEYNPFRGNQFKKPEMIDTVINSKATQIAKLDSLGRVNMVEFPDTIYRDKYPRSDLRNYLDGDSRSSFNNNEWNSRPDIAQATDRLYNPDGNTGEGMLTTRISNTTRVYKGGGWRDRAYWLNPATRRTLEQNKAQDDIGFRCAMDRVGSSSTFR